MISEYYHKNKRFPFVIEDTIDLNRNVFTVLVGKNGTGKSTLLGSVVRNLIGGQNSRYFYRDEELGFRNIQKSRLSVDRGPDRIIAVSTSPFDKFPVKRSLEEIEEYSYLGLRGLHTTNFGLAYLSKIISSLIESIHQDYLQAREIGNILEYLGYKDFIRVVFNISSSKRQLEEFIELESPESLFERRINPSLRQLNKRFFFDEYGNINTDKFDYLKYLSHKILEYDLRRNYELIIHRNGIDSEYNLGGDFDKEIIFLIQSGLLRLRDVGLESLNNPTSFSIKNASSGEQSVILSMLGIASQLKDNSLICIDEPEICLHPQWQEKYIQILISTFENYRNCQFLIATHSPQIISNLRERNCFILSMETGKIDHAAQFINKSSDYQLANVFDSPGFKNEYLSRIALNIFTKVSKRKKFDNDDLEKFRILEHQSLFLEPNDPVLDIYNSLNKMLKVYG